MGIGPIDVKLAVMNVFKNMKEKKNFQEPLFSTGVTNLIGLKRQT